MKNTNVENIYTEVVQRYSHDRNVVGILVFGSMARGTADQFSDVDIYIISKSKGEISRLSFQYEQKQVELLFDSTEDLRAFLKAERSSVHRNISQMMAQSKVLYASDAKILDTIINEARANLATKTKLTRDEIVMHRYSTSDFLVKAKRDAHNKDAIAFGMTSGLLVANVLELFLKINGLYFKQPKDLSKDLAKIDERFAKLLSSFYESRSLKEKQLRLSKIAEYGFSIAGGRLPAKWQLMVKN